MIEAAARAPHGKLIKKLKEFRGITSTRAVVSTYHQRQDTLSVSAPPIKGPITDAIAYAEPMKPLIAGLLCSGADTPIMM